MTSHIGVNLLQGLGRLRWEARGGDDGPRESRPDETAWSFVR